MGKNYFEMIRDGILVDGSGGGDAPAPVLITKSVTANGEYSASDDSADGYSTVSVDVPNSYTAQDEGKVVQSGALVSQTAVEKTVNGTYDTTTNNSVVVNVANSYVADDEGKVVSNGALVAQGSDTVTENGTVDTTLISSLVVAVSGGVGGSLAQLTTTTNNVTTCDMYIFEPDNGSYIYMFGVVRASSGTRVTYNVPESFPIDDIKSFRYGIRGLIISGGSPLKMDIANSSVNKTNRTIYIYDMISDTALIVIAFNKVAT